MAVSGGQERHTTVSKNLTRTKTYWFEIHSEDYCLECQKELLFVTLAMHVKMFEKHSKVITSSKHGRHKSCEHIMILTRPAGQIDT